MEIHALKISFTEQDVNALARNKLPKDSPVEKLEVRLAPEGATVKGVYPMFVNVNFEAQWELGVRDGKLSARLASLRAMGMPGNIFKSALMKIIAEAAKKNDGVTVEDDTILADLDKMLAEDGISAGTHLKSVVCQAGLIVIEAGSG